MEFHHNTPNPEPDFPVLESFNSLLREGPANNPSFHDDLLWECKRLVEAELPTAQLKPFFKNAFNSGLDGHTLTVLGQTLGEVHSAREDGLPRGVWENLTKEFAKIATPLLKKSRIETPLLLSALGSLPSPAVARLLSEVARGTTLDSTETPQVELLRKAAVDTLKGFGPLALPSLSGIESYTVEKAVSNESRLRSLGAETLEKVLSSEMNRRESTGYPEHGFTQFPYHHVETRKARSGELRADMRYQFLAKKGNGPHHVAHQSECRVRYYHTKSKEPVFVFSFDDLSYGDPPVKNLSGHVGILTHYFGLPKPPQVYLIDPVGGGSFHATEVTVHANGGILAGEDGFDPNEHFIQQLGIAQPGFVSIETGKAA